MTGESGLLEKETVAGAEPGSGAVMSQPASAPGRGLAWLFEKLKSRAPAPFEIVFWDGSAHSFGQGVPEFRVSINNKSGMAALQSLDEIQACEAYMRGDIDLEGDMLKLFDLRRILSDRHPLLNLWRLVRPLFTGQVRDDRNAIKEHYEYDDDFYMILLDDTRTYSQGVYEREDDGLGAAMRRKLDFAINACELKPGMRVLDVGGGWGAFTEYAGSRGIQVTSLTIADASLRYLNELIRAKNLPCRAIQKNFLEYESDEKYDAIVILGVIEHMPDYDKVVAQFEKLLKPGGKAYLDGSAGRKKFEFNLFLNRYIYPGNHCTLSIHDFLTEVQKSGMELLTVHSDRHNYYLTARDWARKLEARRDEIINRWGRALYCKFHLYLWGVSHNFLTNQLQAYRLVLQLNPAR